MSKGHKIKALKVPREWSDIQKEYQELCMNAGQLQYQITVYEADLARMNARLLEINNEGAARKQLDAAKSTEETK